MGIFCGVDIIEIDRIEKSFSTVGTAFRDKVFTSREIEYCESRKASRFKSYAARFAAKEAVSKAFGTGIASGIGLKDIEVVNDSLGKPCAELHGEALERFRNMGAIGISLSLSHSDNYAVAYAVIETGKRIKDKFC